MLVFKRFIVFCLLIFLSACAAQKISKPVLSPPPAPSLPLVAGPEEGFSLAMDAFKAGDMNTTVLIAQQVGEQYPNTIWQKRSLFLLGRALIELDKSPQAEDTMLRVTAEYPELADYALYFLAEYYFSKTRYAEAADTYEVLLEKHPKSFWEIRAALKKGHALKEAGAYAKAAEAYQKFLRDYPHADLSPEARLGLGKAYALDGNMVQAVTAFLELSIHHPGSPADLEGRSALDELKSCGAEIPELKPDDLYVQGKNYFKASQYAKAYDAFMRVLEAEPSYPEKTDILLRVGVSLSHMGKRAEAASVLEHMMKEHPPESHGAQALNWLGKVYSRLGKRDEAISSYLKIIASYPSSDLADDALYLIGNIYRESNDLKKALKFYDRLAREYPDSKFADSTYWWKAWTYYTSGDFRNADRTLRELIVKYPKSFLVNQALYWQGRIAEKRADANQAAPLYRKVLARAPYTYYGHRATERLLKMRAPAEEIRQDTFEEAADLNGFLFPNFQEPYETDGPPVWTEEAVGALSAEPSFKKTLELMHLNMKKEAAAELWSLQNRIARKRGALLGLSKAFFELGDYYRSLILVLRNYERYLEGAYWATPDDFWLLAYPQGYWESILTYSRKYSQDPFFIAAIIREESQFHVEALSPAGARGIMQVMPSTGEWVAQTIKLKGFDRAKLFEYDTGIQIGTWYISHLMKRFKGDALLVAAGYNAGPEAVLSWLDKRGRAVERDEFVEMIPFSETRGYVKKVLRNYGEYRRVYGKASQNVSIAPFFLEGTVGSLLEQAEQAGVK